MYNYVVLLHLLVLSSSVYFSLKFIVDGLLLTHITGFIKLPLLYVAILIMLRAVPLMLLNCNNNYMNLCTQSPTKVFYLTIYSTYSAKGKFSIIKDLLLSGEQLNH